MHTIFVQCVEIQKVSQKRLQFLKDTNHRIKTLHGHIMQYDMDGKEINGYYISAGFVDDNLIYAKKEKLSDERGMDNE